MSISPNNTVDSYGQPVDGPIVQIIAQSGVPLPGRALIRLGPGLVGTDVPGPRYTLLDSTGGSVVDATLTDLLLVTDPASSNYVVTYSSGLVQSETWSDLAAVRLKDIVYTYTGQLITGEVISVYGSGGVTAIGRVTVSYTYNGSNQLISSQRLRVI